MDSNCHRLPPQEHISRKLEEDAVLARGLSYTADVSSGIGGHVGTCVMVTAR